MTTRPAPALIGGATGPGSLLANSTEPHRPLLLVCGASATVNRLSGHPHLGSLIQPRSGNRIDTIATSGRWWAADNDALAGIDPDRYMTMLNAIAQTDTRRLLFVTVPDAVQMTDTGPIGDWAGTLWLFRSWQRALITRTLPAAIVLQDGATIDSVPWGEIAAVFVGGSTAFKEGPDAAAILREAHRRGIWRHVGRINTERRLRLLDVVGFDSFDGTQFSRFPDTYIPRWLERLTQKQEGLAL